MTHLIVHAGFHKTGTTTAQKSLELNKHLLSDHVRVLLRSDMLALCEAARAWSISRSDLDYGLVIFEAAAVAERLADVPMAILSSEDLSGHMPGRWKLTSYDAAPRLMAALDHAFRNALKGAQVTFHFSTRNATDWLASCHAQHLRATRMKLSAQEYIETYKGSADLASVIAQVAAEVPKAQISNCPLEASSGEFGPAGPLLDLAGVPDDLRTKLRKVDPAYARLDAQKLDRLLALNRSKLDTRSLRTAKRAVQMAEH